MDRERYQPQTVLPKDPVYIQQARDLFVDGGKTGDFDKVAQAIKELDLVREATRPEILRRLGDLGKLPGWKKDLNDGINLAKGAGDWQRVQELVRVAHLMGQTEDPMVVNLMRILDHNIPSADDRYRKLYEQAEQEKAAQAVARAQAQAAAQTAAQQAAQAAQAQANAQAAAQATAAAASQPTPPNSGCSRCG